MKWFKGIEVAKDPDAVKDWRWDWSDWLGEGDSIADHEAYAEDGLTVDTSAISGYGVTVKLSGGAAGSSYSLTVEITTTYGLKDQRTVTFVVGDQ